MMECSGSRYDNLYRLTSETIASDLSGMNGATGYVYDTVGNRQRMTSTLPAIAPGRWNYDANDRLTSDQNDADGNITSRAGVANAYDFENHLIQHGFMTFVYDGDGNRVAKTIGGVTTNYLVDALNPTGYAQVLDELQSNTVMRSYTWGLQLVSESQRTTATPPANPWVTSWYGLDGHGSVRYLANSNGAVTDSYDFDAFGNLINSTGSTANNYLFAGEQFDPDLGLYYNRARYLDVQLGRFWGMDTYEGSLYDPTSLHKYLYANASPVDALDPSGNDSILEMLNTVAIRVIVFTMNNARLFTALGTAVAAINIGLFITNEDFRTNVMASLGPAQAAQMLTQDVSILFGFAGATADALFLPAQGAKGRQFVLDLFGGAESQIPGAINVDLRAGASGVRADVADLPFQSECVDKIVVSGPRANFLDEAARVLKPGGRIYVNYTIRNKFGKMPDEGTLQALRLRPVVVGGDLDSQFAGQTFQTTDGGVIPNSSVKTTILEKY